MIFAKVASKNSAKLDFFFSLRVNSVTRYTFSLKYFLGRCDYRSIYFFFPSVISFRRKIWIFTYRSQCKLTISGIIDNNKAYVYSRMKRKGRCL